MASGPNKSIASTAPHPARIVETGGNLAGSAAGLFMLWTGFVAATLFLYLPFLLGQVPAFRDAFHFYYPFAIWAESQFAWMNVWDGMGTNVVGEASTAVFYPGRVVFWLPGLSVAQRFGIYLLLHTWLSAATSVWAGRRMGLSNRACALSGITYSLSCPNLFQHTNPIFLVGAAWLPIIVAEGYCLASGRAVRWSCWCLAASMALLGGDPQSTATAMLVTALAITICFWHTENRVMARRATTRFLMAVGIVIGLTAIQWMPTWHWMQLSNRSLASQSSTNSSSPSIRQALIPAKAELNATAVDSPELPLPALLKEFTTHPDPSTDDVRSPVYEFSVAPWHFATMIWGTALGSYLPTNTRWIDAFRAEPRMWIPSLSFGLLPCLLAMIVWTQRSTSHGLRLLKLMTLLACLAMLGNYTPTWALRHLLNWLGTSTAWLPTDEVGGVYWLFTQSIPGFSSFRYPAKWSIWFVCGACLSAAHGFDRLCQYQSIETRLRWSVGGLAVGTAGLLTCLMIVCKTDLSPILRGSVARWLDQAPADGWLGQVQYSSAVNATATSLALTLVILVSFWFAQRQRAVSPTSLLIWISLIELVCSAATWMSAVPVPQGDDVQGLKSSTAIPRLWASIAKPNVSGWALREASSPDAIALRPNLTADQVCRYQQLFRLGKLHLLEPGIANVTALGTLTPRALARVRQRIARVDDMRIRNQPLAEALAWLGVTHRLVDPLAPEWQSIPNAKPMLEVISRNDLSSATTGETHVEADRISINVRYVEECVVVLRCIQDGGWSATLESLDGQMIRVTPRVCGLGLFQYISVPPGDWKLQFRYFPPGLMLGTWTSLATAAFLVVLWLVQHRSNPPAKASYNRNAVGEVQKER